MFAFLRREVRIHLQQLFRVDELDVVRKERFYLRIHFAHHVFGASHGRIDACHDLLEERHGALFRSDGALPVPLVHIQRVEVAQLLVGTNGVHVGIDTIPRTDVIVGQGQSFPFSQGVNHFRLGIVQVLDWESHGAFLSAQVVVDTHPLQYEKRCGHSSETQFRREVLLEELLYLFDAQLGLFHVEYRLIISGFYQITHVVFFLCFRKCCANIDIFCKYATKIGKNIIKMFANH